MDGSGRVWVYGFRKIRALEYGNGMRSEYCYGNDEMPSGLVTVTPTGEVVLNYDYA